MLVKLCFSDSKSNSLMTVSILMRFDEEEAKKRAYEGERTCYKTFL